MITSFNDFSHKYKFEKTATSKINFYQVRSSLFLSDDVGIFSRDGPFKNDIGIINLHPSKGTHWVLYISQYYFDSYGFDAPQKLSRFIIKRKRHCVYSEYTIQGLTKRRDFSCASYCLYKIYLTKVVGVNFKSAVLNLYFQMIQ